MKSIQHIVAALFLSFSIASAQVMNDAKILPQGKVNLGAAPFAAGGDVGFYTGLGYGVARGVDLGIVVGFLNNGTYVGANFEFPLSNTPNISCAFGGHTAGSTTGIDGTFNLSFPVGGSASLYGGFDADLNFNNGTTTLPAWFFFAVNVKIRSNIELFLEVDPALSNDASDLFGGGVKISL